jgi:superfamily II DNA or RNA helicase
MDEAHNSVRRSFYEHVEVAKSRASRCFFLTATPKISKVPSKPGMNNKQVYGEIIYTLPATKLADEGYILKPKVVAKQIENNEDPIKRDYEFIQKILEDEVVNKLLISVKSTKNMMNLFTETDFKNTLKDLGYSLLHITSQHGAFIDDKKVTRDKFFRILNTWGKERDKKFVVMNHSILGEGINVSCLDAVCFMRSMDVISLLQNTGRTLRLDPSDADGIKNGTVIPGDFSTYLKPEGLVILPVFDKATKIIAEQIEAIMNSVFKDGQLVYSEVTK